VPLVPDDYIHRIGRTGRADAVGTALTFASPDERSALAAIERAIGRPLPRITVPDFDYQQRSSGPLEIPHAQRIAEIRARKAQERSRRHSRPTRPQPPHARESGAGDHPPKGQRRRWSFKPRRRR